MRADAWSASPVDRAAELARASGNPLALVTDGTSWTLVWARPGESTGICAWRADLWLEEPFTLRAFVTLLGAVRRVIYTTNAIEALNRQLRKAVKTKGSFPSEEAAIKLLYLAIHNAVPQWTRTRGWTKAMLAFKIQFGDRLPD